MCSSTPNPLFRIGLAKLLLALVLCVCAHLLIDGLGLNSPVSPAYSAVSQRAAASLGDGTALEDAVPYWQPARCHVAATLSQFPQRWPVLVLTSFTPPPLTPPPPAA